MYILIINALLCVNPSSSQFAIANEMFIIICKQVNANILKVCTVFSYNEFMSIFNSVGIESWSRTSHTDVYIYCVVIHIIIICLLKYYQQNVLTETSVIIYMKYTVNRGDESLRPAAGDE